MNRVVNRPIALVISQWLQSVVPFILDQRNSFSQSALSWHVPVKCKKLKDCDCEISVAPHFFITLQLMSLCDMKLCLHICYLHYFFIFVYLSSSFM